MFCGHRCSDISECASKAFGQPQKKLGPFEADASITKDKPGLVEGPIGLVEGRIGLVEGRIGLVEGPIGLV